MSKKRIPPIERGEVCLRLLERTDLERTLAWRNRNRMWFVNSSVLSFEQHLAWFTQYLGRDDDYVFVIEKLSGSRQPVGQISLYKIDWAGRKAEFGRLLIGDPNARRRGIARTATGMLLDHAFEKLGLRTVHLEVLSNNIPAKSLYEQCGFVQSASKNGLVTMVKSAENSTGRRELDL